MTIGLGASTETREQSSLPLKATRTVAFTASEGTWMSLDVSPDGRTIVFDLLGDLYTLPITGGQASPLTSGVAFDSQPRFSPDGREVVFTSDRDGWVNVWIVAVTGASLRQVTHHRWSGFEQRVESPEWTPEGNAIVVSEFPDRSDIGLRLVEYRLNGDSPRVVTRSVGRGGRLLYRGAAFGSDTQYVYAAVKMLDERDAYSANWQIAKISRRTGSATPETSPLSGLSAMRPLLSPNGRYLVFGAPSGGGTGLRVRDLVTDKETWLVREAQSTNANFGGKVSRDLLPGSSFTPDSTAIVTAFNGHIMRIEVDSGAVMQIPFTVAVERNLGPLVRSSYRISGQRVSRSIQLPQVSPDGAHVAFTVADRVWIADLPDISKERHLRSSGSRLSQRATNVRRLTTGAVGEFFPAWSADGKEIAYAVWSDKHGGGVYRAPVDGSSRPVLVTRERGYYVKLAFSENGDIIALQGSEELLRQVSAWSVPQADSDLKMWLTRISKEGVQQRLSAVGPWSAGLQWKEGALVYGRPHFAGRDVRRVFMYEPEQGLFSTTLDGTDRRVAVKGINATQFSSRRLQATDALMSPDGQQVLALLPLSKQVYLIRTPEATGNAAPNVSVSDAQGPATQARLISQTGADYIGWTADGRPYMSAGNVLLIATEPISGETNTTPTFQEISIEVPLPSYRTEARILLHGATLLTMHNHECIDKGDVLVEAGRIAQVGPVGTVTAPAGTPVLDLTGMTILPGYVDVHDHVSASLSRGIHKEEEPRLMIDLAHGVTTIRDPAGPGLLDLLPYAERAAIGDLTSPRIFTVAAAILPQSFGDGGQQDLAVTRDVLRLWGQYYASETIKQYEAGGRRTRQLIAMAAADYGLTPTNEGAFDPAINLTMMLDGYGAIEHAMPVRELFDDVVQLYVRSGVIDTPTLGAFIGFRRLLRSGAITDDAKMRRFYPPLGVATMLASLESRPSGMGYPRDDQDTVKAIVKPFMTIGEAGGCVAVGSHGNAPGIGQHYEIWLLSEGGMAAYDALRNATMCSARSIGHEADLGSLEVGKLADLQVLSHSPLTDIKNTLSIRFVMASGRLYDAETLDVVWPVPARLTEQWWWSESSSAQRSDAVRPR